MGVDLTLAEVKAQSGVATPPARSGRTSAPRSTPAIHSCVATNRDPSFGAYFELPSALLFG